MYTTALPWVKMIYKPSQKLTLMYSLPIIYLELHVGNGHVSEPLGSGD